MITDDRFIPREPEEELPIYPVSPQGQAGRMHIIRQVEGEPTKIETVRTEPGTEGWYEPRQSSGGHTRVQMMPR